MQIDQWLIISIKKLEDNTVSTARLDCLILLEDATNKDRGWLIAHPEYALQGLVLKKLNTQIERRAKHEPLSYIRGHSEFYGREFIVTRDTLQPRPESETIIDLLRELILSSQNSSLLQDSPLTDVENVIIDVGTGTGVLGITAKLELTGIKVVATDISYDCIKVAKRNAKKLGADVAFFQGDLLEPVPLNRYTGKTILLVNLPYVPDGHVINEAAKYEPPQAIFGGSDGLELYRSLFLQLNMLTHKPMYVLTESLPFQHKQLSFVATTSGYTEKGLEKFIQLFKLRA